jgi:hypothetical protein
MISENDNGGWFSIELKKVLSLPNIDYIYPLYSSFTCLIYSITFIIPCVYSSMLFKFYSYWFMVFNATFNNILAILWRFAAMNI